MGAALSRMEKICPQDDPRPPLLARWFSPAGPPRVCRLSAAGAAVTSVPGRYSVTHVVEGPRALALVDVGSGADLPALGRVLKGLGKPVRWIIASHLHFDHVWGIEAACEAFSARLRLGEVAFDCVRTGHRPRGVKWYTTPFFFPSWLWQGLPLPARVDIKSIRRIGSPLSRNDFCCQLGPALRDGERLDGFPGWRALDTPGHADEAICLWHEGAGFLIAGDTVRNYRGGEWNPLVTDPADYARTQERLRRLEVRAVFPAHGPNLVGEGLLDRLRCRRIRG